MTEAGSQTPADFPDQPLCLPPGVFSFWDFVTKAKTLLAKEPEELRRLRIPLMGAERLVAEALVGYFTIALAKGTIVNDKPYKNFLDLLPREIVEAWSYLCRSGDDPATCFRSTFRIVYKRDPVELLDLAGGKSRIDDVELVLRVIRKIGNSALLPPALRAFLYARDTAVLQYFGEFIETVYLPRRGGNVKAGIQSRAYRTWNGRLLVHQHGTALTFTFRDRWRFSRRKKLTFTGDIFSVRGEEFTFLCEGIAGEKAIGLIKAFVRKYGKELERSFEPADVRRRKLLFPGDPR